MPVLKKIRGPIHLVSFYLLIMLLKKFFTVTTRLKDLIKMCALF